MKKIKPMIYLLALALTLCVGGFFLSVTALAGTEEPQTVLSVDAARLEGDTLFIDVTNTRTGVAQTLTVNLVDYAGSTDEYITIQAVDGDGNVSNAVRFLNPYYKEPVEQDSPEPSAQAGTDPAGTPAPADSGAFTPDGTGTVLDNVTDSDGKEFFTVRTEDGNTFYLIIDRQRSMENVYLLNAVTEDDLMSLARPGDGKSAGAIPSSTPAPTPSSESTPTPSPPAAEAAAKSGGIGGGAVIFIIIAALAVGGAGYYFKILKPRRQAADSEDEEYEDEYENAEADDGADEDIDYGYSEEDDE